MEGKLKTSVHEHAGSRNKNTSAAHPTPESFADRFLADNYVTYMPSLSGSMGEMTLGGGTRLMTDASVSKYSEDIADRNMTKTTRQQKPAGERNMDNTVNLNDNEGNDNEDVDQTIEWAPAVINEIIKPHEHEIITERVHRDIHNYEVYHRIQPVLDTEILPARHFVPSSSQSHLIEVSEQDLPDCTGDNQPWIVGERKSPANEQFHTPQAQLTEPKAGGYQTFTTPEGFERKQTTWLHPAELEDMGGYDGPVMPVHFGEDGQHTEPPKSEITNMRDVRAFSQSGTNANPTTNPSMNPRRTKPAHPPKYINAPVVPPRKSSLRHSMNGSTTIE